MGATELDTAVQEAQRRIANIRGQANRVSGPTPTGFGQGVVAQAVLVLADAVLIVGVMVADAIERRQ